MLFNSFDFIIFFLPITFGIYFILNKKRLTLAANAWLLCASLFFYSYWNIAYLPLILISILFNYVIGGILIDYDNIKKQIVSKKVIFVVGISGNICLLCYYKYMDFFINNINNMLNTNISLLHIILPLGISFFTITQIAFLVDSYEGLVQEKNLLNYALFVTFFPHLLAGPILHHKEMMPQFAETRNKVLNYKNISRGFLLFFIGLFKKVVIADSVAKYATAGFDVAPTLNFVEAWFTSLSYTLQLYFDFSGYSDMAIGVGLMFNIKLPINFNSPYKAVSAIDFWRRWHITLSNFITTYIYSAFVRSFSKITFYKSLAAIFLAMFVSGLWHGAGWTFIIWGSLHGLALVINHIWRSKLKIKLNFIISWLITINFVNISFVFFRAKNFDDALKVLKGMCGFNGIVLPKFLGKYLSLMQSSGVKFAPLLNHINGNWYMPIIMASLISIILFTKNSNEMTDNLDPNWKYAVFTSIIAVVGILNITKVSEFLYFNF